MSQETYSGLAASYDYSTPSSTSYPTGSQGSRGTLSPYTPDSNFDASPLQYPLDWRSMWSSDSEQMPLYRAPSLDFHHGLEEATAASTSNERKAVSTPSSSGKPKPEEPYAKLIQRALLSVDNHKMPLQEIYQWFRENTEKGKNGSKGWQNSIRHNLSMNAAFLKCERGGIDGGRKSTEWQLAPFAVHGAVQSTTRYRKGNPPRRVNETSSRRGRSGINKSRSDLRRSVMSQPFNDYPAIGVPQSLGFYNYLAPQPIDNVDWMAQLNSQAELPNPSFGFVLPSNGILPHVQNDYDDIKLAYGEI
ncbi:hypothetical protein F4679DRAFT_586835 [Xylaria curta]|nr:hypothetical protein F4679DRAFT_586835 [Xylaria curta]